MRKILLTVTALASLAMTSYVQAQDLETAIARSKSNKGDIENLQKEEELTEKRCGFWLVQEKAKAEANDRRIQIQEREEKKLREACEEQNRLNAEHNGLALN
jgi:hypothetical protein